jgi:hypothetical protein
MRTFYQSCQFKNWYKHRADFGEKNQGSRSSMIHENIWPWIFAIVQRTMTREKDGIGHCHHIESQT